MASIQTSHKKKPAKKHETDNCCNSVKVAYVIACYVNPAIYILFSVVYFSVGFSIQQ